jgi:REP-associated tyrosine transposase
MPRRLREHVPGGIHHAVAKGNAGAAIVRDDDDRDALTRRLALAVDRHAWSCLSFCLLDTHIHVVLGTPRPTLSRGMQWLLGGYAQHFNRKHSREGHLFRGRFYSRRIRSEDHLVSTLTYVALNPVRAGLVEEPEHWRWSSYGGTVGRGMDAGFIDNRAVLELFGADSPAAQIRFEFVVAEARARDLD